METEFKQNVDNPSIKLIKNTRGYNWEIRVTSLDLNELDKINTEMLKKYGVDNESN